MTLEEFASLFEKYKSEYRKFKNIEYPNPGILCNRPDLHAFIMLNELIFISEMTPKNLISSVGHDCFYFNINCEELAWKISDERLRKPEIIIADLIRCGVMYDKENKWLWMST